MSKFDPDHPLQQELSRDAGNENHDPATGQFASGSGTSQASHKHFTGKGFKPYSHSPREQGYIDPSGSKMKVEEAHQHMLSQGYKPSANRHTGEPVQGQKGMGGMKHWAYEKSAGPQNTHSAHFSSMNGSHLHNALFSLRHED